MALTNWNDILSKPKGIDEVPEIALTVEQLSASVLSLEEDVAEIALDISQLSASTLPYSEEQSIKDEIDSKQNSLSSATISTNLNNASGGTANIEMGVSWQNVKSIVPIYSDDWYYLMRSDGFGGLSWGVSGSALVLLAPGGKSFDEITSDRNISFKIYY